MKILIYLIIAIIWKTSAYAQAETHNLNAIRTVMEQNDARWVPFLKKENLLAGVYTIKAGDTDQQQPHPTDEIYYVIEGRGSIEIDGTTQKVVKGNIIYVPANASHHFSDIIEDLVLLVVFDQ